MDVLRSHCKRGGLYLNWDGKKTFFLFKQNFPYEKNYFNPFGSFSGTTIKKHFIELFFCFFLLCLLVFPVQQFACTFPQIIFISFVTSGWFSEQALNHGIFFFFFRKNLQIPFHLHICYEQKKSGR